MADRGDANLDQILGRQIRKNVGVNMVFAESRLVLPQTQPVKPSRNVHRRLLTWQTPGASA